MANPAPAPAPAPAAAPAPAPPAPPATPATPAAPVPVPTHAQLRAEFDGLLAAFGRSMTPASDDPKETRKLGPLLTPDQSKRLHDLHALLA